MCILPTSKEGENPNQPPIVLANVLYSKGKGKPKYIHCLLLKRLYQLRIDPLFLVLQVESEMIIPVVSPVLWVYISKVCLCQVVEYIHHILSYHTSLSIASMSCDRTPVRFYHY